MLLWVPNAYENMRAEITDYNESNLWLAVWTEKRTRKTNHAEKSDY